MPRELNTQSISNDYRPKRVRMLVPSDMGGDGSEIDEFHERGHSDGAMGISRRMNSGQVNLHKLEHDLTRDPLGEIASMVRALTYGEMMELAQAIWKIRPEGESVDQDSLPMLLHRWSTSSEH